MRCIWPCGWGNLNRGPVGPRHGGTSGGVTNVRWRTFGGCRTKPNPTFLPPNRGATCGGCCPTETLSLRGPETAVGACGSSPVTVPVPETGSLSCSGTGQRTKPVQTSHGACCLWTATKKGLYATLKKRANVREQVRWVGRDPGWWDRLDDPGRAPSGGCAPGWSNPNPPSAPSFGGPFHGDAPLAKAVWVAPPVSRLKATCPAPVGCSRTCCPGCSWGTAASTTSRR